MTSPDPLVLAAASTLARDALWILPPPLADGCEHDLELLPVIEPRFTVLCRKCGGLDVEASRAIGSQDPASPEYVILPDSSVKLLRKPSPDPLAAFCRARLDEDEAAAKAATPGPWFSWIEGRDHFGGDSFIQTSGDRDLLLNFMPAEYKGRLPEWEADQDHIARHDPSRALREAAAERQLITFAFENAASIDGEWGDCHSADEIAAGQCSDHGAKAARGALSILAAIWSDHPDYDQAWKP